MRCVGDRLAPALSPRVRTEAERLSEVRLVDDLKDETAEDLVLVALPGVSFFDEGDADEAVCDFIWSMFAKDSNQRGFDCRSQSSISATQRVAKSKAITPKGTFRC